MRLRTLAGGLLGAGGAVAVGNRLLAARAPALEPPLDRQQAVHRWRGVDVAYTEAGDPADPDLLLLHGIHAAATSAEFDRVVDQLAADHHVLAPDLPGFGCSDRPALVYRAGLYRQFVRAFCRDRTDEPRVVASSLTGALAASALADVGPPVADLLLVCPTPSTGASRRWLRTLVRSPVVGEGLFNLLTSRPSLRYYLREQAFAHPGAVPSDWVEYAWTTAHQPGARYAPASFVAGDLDPDADLAATLAAVDAPVTLVWGRAASLPPLSTGRDLAERADVRLLVVDDAALLPHAEQPASFVEVVRDPTDPGAG